MRTSPRLGVLPRLLVGAIVVVLLLGIGRAVDLGALSSVAADGPVPSTGAPPAAGPTSSGPSAQVAPLGKPVVADVLLTSSAPIPAEKIAQVDGLTEVTAVEPFRFGTVDLAGARVPAYGVNPSTFRNWAVPATAASDGFWRSLAGGEAAASFAAAKDLNLSLGGRLPIGAAKSETMRVGSFATVGFPDAEAVLAEPQAAAIGLPPSSGVLLSAPDADLRSMVGMLGAVFGPDVAVRPLREMPTPAATNPGSSAPPSSSAGPTSTGVPGYSVPSGGVSSSSGTAGTAGTASSETVSRLIETAKSRIGAPYVYGASGPDSFDCSGFTSWVFRQVGVGLPRTAHEQWLSGPHVSYSEAQPGDILAWAGDGNAPNYVTHVAIYLGNGQMIAAPRTGTTVNISSVYTSGLLGAVRVLR